METGLSYFGGRYYHAALGRWLNRDPIGECGGVNLYAYALNDPVHIDPLGHAVCVPGWHGCPGGGQPEDGRCPRKGQADALYQQARPTTNGGDPQLEHAMYEGESMHDGPRGGLTILTCPRS